MRGLSLVAASGGHSSSWCAGLSLSWPLLLRSTGSRYAGSVIVAHGPSCSAACGIFPDQGSNPCPLHRQADSQPLRHQGSPPGLFFYNDYMGYSTIVMIIPILQMRTLGLRDVHQLAQSHQSRRWKSRDSTQGCDVRTCFLQGSCTRAPG